MEEILMLWDFMKGAILPMLATCVIAIAISHYRFMRQKTVSLGTAATSLLLGPAIAFSALLSYHHTWEIFNLLVTPPEPQPFCLFRPSIFTFLTAFGLLAAPSIIPAFGVPLYYQRRAALRATAAA
jgi:hypothetical protein